MTIITRTIKGGYEDCNGTFTIAVLFLILTIIFGAIIIIVPAQSWNENVEMHITYDGTVEQYRDAVTMYQDKAIINVSKAFTDFKYEGYQANIAQFIIELREEVTQYNKILIKKRMQKRNIMQNWLIFQDESLPLIKLTD